MPPSEKDKAEPVAGRTRKLSPGFFLNEDLAKLPPLVRGVFPGLWIYADREGRLQDRPLKLKAQILPYDDVDFDEILQRLHDAGFIVRYAVGDGKYIQVNNFLKYQHPHPHEPKSVIPPINGTVITCNDIGKPCNEMDDVITCHDNSAFILNYNYNLSTGGDTGGGKPSIPPPLALLKIWNEHRGPMLPEATKLSDSRRTKCKARLSETPDLEVWRAAAKRVAASDFCTGQKKGVDWRATFDWFIQKNSLLKILEGQYDNRQPRSTSTGLTQQEFDAIKPVPIPEPDEESPL